MNDTDQNEEKTEEVPSETEATASEATVDGEAKSKKPELNTTRGWNPKNKHFDHESSHESDSAPRKSTVKKPERKKKTQMAKKSRRTNRKK